MVFQLSPSVSVAEKDLSNIIPAVATSLTGTVGQFTWGPVEEITIVDNEEQLVDLFGKPNDTNFKDFFSATSFLAYSSGLRVVRVVDVVGDSNTDPALNASVTGSAGGAGQLIKNLEDYENKSFTSSLDLFVAKYPGTLGNSLGIAWADTTGFNDTDSDGVPTWSWHDLFDSAPGTNEFHIVVYDADGAITGTANTALERFPFVSSDADALYFDGSSAYFVTRLNRLSEWVWVANPTLLADTEDGIQFTNGADGGAVSASDRQAGWDLYADAENVDISILFAAGADSTSAKYVIDNIVETRKDCVVCVSPQASDVVGVASDTTKLTSVKSTRNGYGSTSYGIMDHTYKYMYDRYNDVHRYVPMNGDVAGCLARTDADTDPWFSPAGYDRGRIKNAKNLSFVASKSIRDELYKVGINPTIKDNVNGPVLFGDKTLLTRPSAFDRINVRRLFITLEKAIATAAKYMLFEQNDDFTRAQFVNMIEPFLQDVKGRRGIIDFRVVCDSTNNTPEVIDRNEFVADIYIAPTKSVNFIKLNFVALRTGVSFDEVVLTGDIPQTLTV